MPADKVAGYQARGGMTVATGQRQAVATVPRLLLLVAVIFGIGLMHTLGHTAMHDSPDCPAPMTATHSAPTPAHDADGGCGGGFDPLSTCMAILVGLGLLAGGIRLMLFTGLPASWAPHRFRARFSRPSGRGPPLIPGLAMTKVAVLRT